MSEELDYSRSFTLETIESNLTEKFNNIVFNSPAGTGKTRSAREYILKHYKEGIIYVAQTKSVLDEMEAFLIKEGIAKDAIANFHSDSEFYKKFMTKVKQFNNIDDRYLYIEEFKTKQVVLVTHSRLLYDAPSSYLELMYLDRFSGTELWNFKTMIIDEAINPCILAEIKITTAKGIFRSIFNTEVEDYLNNTISNEDDLISKTKEVYNYFITGTYNLKNGGKRLYFLDEWNIELQDSSNLYSRVNKESYDILLDNKLRNIYYAIAKQLVKGEFIIRNDNLILVIPLALQQVWYSAVKNLIILDATSHLTPFFYEQFKIVNGVNWNLDKIKIVGDQCVIGPTKTKLNELVESNKLEELDSYLDRLTSNLNNYNKVYISTFKILIPYVLNYLQNRFKT